MSVIVDRNGQHIVTSECPRCRGYNIERQWCPDCSKVPAKGKRKMRRQK